MLALEEFWKRTLETLGCSMIFIFFPLLHHKLLNLKWLHVSEFRSGVNWQYSFVAVSRAWTPFLVGLPNPSFFFSFRILFLMPRMSSTMQTFCYDVGNVSVSQSVSQYVHVFTHDLHKRYISAMIELLRRLSRCKSVSDEKFRSL